MPHEYIDDECYRCMHYVKFITDSNAWTCEVCHLIEIGREDPADPQNDIIWGRYELECGHQAHIRCLRKWCKEAALVGCPSCGPVDEARPYCNKCDVFGHATGSCS